MSDFGRTLMATAYETLFDVGPVIAVLAFFQLAVLRRPLPRPKRIAVGLICIIGGLTLFLVGLEQALFPLGRAMARQLVDPAVLGLDHRPGWRDYGWVYAFAAAIGFATTIAEPALLAVALQANHVSGGTIPVFGLRVAVALGVAAGVAIGCFRIITGTPLALYIVAGYTLVALQTLAAPKPVVPLAYDSGGVTTSTVTVPVVAALGLGLAATIPGRSPLVDGFGLIAFASLFPIMSVLAFAGIAERLQRWRSRKGGASA
jgi:hypothetical protein